MAVSGSHSHDHGHGHAHGDGANRRRTGLAALLTGGFMLAEVAGGILSGSLALIADAAHMLTDTVALTLAWLAFRLADRDGGAAMTYGLRRLPILVAFANGLALFFVVGWIAVEAVRRLAEPVVVLAGPLLVVAALGLVVNIVAFALLHGADRTSLNIRGALWHVVGDLLGSLAALAAGVIIYATGWFAADPLLSLAVALIVLVGAWRLTRDSGRILMEGAPLGLDVEEIGRDLVGHVAGVEDVHHVHVWSLTEEGIMATLHARVSDAGAGDAVLAAIRARLKDRFGIGHATIQIECEGC